MTQDLGHLATLPSVMVRVADILVNLEPLPNSCVCAPRYERNGSNPRGANEKSGLVP